MATSYNGWTASRDPDAIGINRDFAPVRGVKFPAGVRGGDVGVVMAWLCTALHTRVEPIMTDPGCWGYYYRANVNNPSVLSCHSSGTAIDWNAPKHPNGVSGTWSSAQYAEITRILNQLENTVRMLKGYDEMHFEVRGSAADVKRVADKIRAGALGAGNTSGGTTMSLDDAAKTYIAQKLNETESQIMGALRLELDELRQTITGGVRTRDETGKVIDPDSANISEADSYTRLEALEALVKRIATKVGA